MNLLAPDSLKKEANKGGHIYIVDSLLSFENKGIFLIKHSFVLLLLHIYQADFSID